MLDAYDSLPDDAAALKALVLDQQVEITARDAEIRSRDVLIEKLKHQLAGMRRNRFGASAEALDQLELVLEGEEIAAAAEKLTEMAASPARKTRPKRKPLPNHLPRIDQVIEPGAAGPVQACWPMCGSPSTPITCRSTGKAKSMPASASVSSARHSPTGSANPPRCWSPWPRRSHAMFLAAKRSSPTILPSGSRRRATAS